ncbi:hypothetical protein, partial [Klebsiella variicola]|uniref:hypothetical protein n=1 Tax=Klebsiella variicola TaxID=244366 RepID=UPI002B052262
TGISASIMPPTPVNCCQKNDESGCLICITATPYNNEMRIIPVIINNLPPVATAFSHKMQKRRMIIYLKIIHL